MTVTGSFQIPVILLSTQGYINHDKPTDLSNLLELIPSFCNPCEGHSHWWSVFFPQKWTQTVTIFSTIPQWSMPCPAHLQKSISHLLWCALCLCVCLNHPKVTRCEAEGTQGNHQWRSIECNPCEKLGEMVVIFKWQQTAAVKSNSQKCIQ